MARRRCKYGRRADGKCRKTPRKGRRRGGRSRARSTRGMKCVRYKRTPAGRRCAKYR